MTLWHFNGTYFTGFDLSIREIFINQFIIHRGMRLWSNLQLYFDMKILLTCQENGHLKIETG